MTSENGTGSSEYALFIHPEVDEIFEALSRKDGALLKRVWKKLDQVRQAPYAFKPLRASLKHRWRVHVGSFVLVYAIVEEQKRIEVLDFDHHDRIYKRRGILGR